MSHIAQFGYPVLQSGAEELADRAAMLFLTMKRKADPSTRKSKVYVPTKGIPQVFAMELAGYPHTEIHGKSAQYAKVTRRWKKLQLAQAREAEANTTLRVQVEQDPEDLIPVPLVTPDDTTNDNAGLDDDDTTTTPNGNAWTEKDVADFLEANAFFPMTYPVDKAEDPTQFSGKELHKMTLSTAGHHRLAPIANLTTTTTHRRTSTLSHPRNHYVSRTP